MNPFVADPDWGVWIILYFYFGGIAAGAYFTSTLIDLWGGKDSRDLPRVGYWIAFPLVMLCGLFLTVDLQQPQRFWHMLFRSEVVDRALDEGWPWTGSSWALMVQAPLLKYWSPMSVGSWALLVFGFCSGLTFLGSLWPEGWLCRLFRRSILARVLQLIGCAVGFFVAAYTGALLTATNQPLWSMSEWIAPLFLTSAATTGIAVMVLLARSQNIGSADALHRLERADLYILGLEAVVFVIFLVSLGNLVGPLLTTWQGILLVAGTALVGLLMPLVLHLRPELLGARNLLAIAVCTLVGGFFLKFGVLQAAPELLARGPAALPAAAEQPQTPAGWFKFSPEDGRQPGKRLGADPLNRPDPDKPAKVQPPSKYFRK
jgi:formate-dependent nitrite reductase membrane component NrfD